MSSFFKKLFGGSDDVTPGYTMEQIEGLMLLAGADSFASYKKLAEANAAELTQKEESLTADAVNVETEAQKVYQEALRVAREALNGELGKAENFRNMAAEIGAKATQAKDLLAVFAK